MVESLQNSVEIAYWNGTAGARWVAFQEHIDRAFAPLSAAGLAEARLQFARAVLDIGCGCGTTLLELAGAVGAGGEVVGIDVSQPMLAVAEQRIRKLGLTNARCMLADASTHSFGADAFDLVFSRFGVMFFDDPVAAFSNVRRSLRSEGRLVFLCWRDLAANPWFSVPMEAVRAHVRPQLQPDPYEPGPLAFADPDRIRLILERSGFGGVELKAFDAELRFGVASSATELLSRIGPAARILAAADDTPRTAAIVALGQVLKTHEKDGEVVLGAGVWVVSARPAAQALIF